MPPGENPKLLASLPAEAEMVGDTVWAVSRGSDETSVGVWGL